jgi:hypothetical protein
MPGAHSWHLHRLLSSKAASRRIQTSRIHGKGAGQKADDNRHVAACHSCHVAIDQGPMPKAEKVRLWNAAFERTRALYIKRFNIDLEAVNAG